MQKKINEGQVNLPELEFLKLLKLQPEKPTLEFLNRLLTQHQRYIPYENISKLIRRNSKGFTLPSFEEYVHEIQTFNYGGTCFAQNIYFSRLLKFLGFDANLQGYWVDGKITHPNIIVSVEGKNYFVDLGIMSSFVGPFVLDPQQAIKKQIGNQTYHFTPGEDHISSHLQIFRNGKMIREHKNSGPTPTEDQIAKGVYDTFEKPEMFMTSFVAHKVFGHYSLGIWNRSFFRDEGSEHKVNEINNFGELREAFHRLEMQNAQMELALDVLRENGIDLY